jgi:hypothetical protein
MRFIQSLKRSAVVLAALLAITAPAFAQTAPTQTTLAAAITDTSSRTIQLASATGVVANSTWILIEKELTRVRAVNGVYVDVVRGESGSKASKHASGAVAVIGAAPVFQVDDLSASGAPTSGSCTSTNELYLPVYNIRNGRRWNCIGSAWMIDNGLAMLPASACVSSVSGNGTGTNGLTTVGTAVVPVMQAQTSATGTNTHTYICSLNAAAWAGSVNSVVRTVSVIDATFFYGVQTTAIGTQVATLASGTMNSSIVFSKVAYPAAAASETASTVTPVRADSGTLVITPVVASFNVATTTAGGFYSAKFAPAVPFAMNTDLAQYFLRVDLLNTATSATITNTPGVLVHFAYIPD